MHVSKCFNIESEEEASQEHVYECEHMNINSVRFFIQPISEQLHLLHSCAGSGADVSLALPLPVFTHRNQPLLCVSGAVSPAGSRSPFLSTVRRWCTDASSALVCSIDHCCVLGAALTLMGPEASCCGDRWFVVHTYSLTVRHKLMDFKMHQFQRRSVMQHFEEEEEIHPSLKE